MAGNPQVQFDADFRVEEGLRRVQAAVTRKPIRVNLATDAKALDGLDKGLGRLSGRADEFTKSLEAANARVLAFGASVSILAALERGFKNLIVSTVEVEKSFKAISVVGDQFASTATQLEKFGRGIFDVARQTGQSFDTTATAALEFARQGLNASETLKRVKDALVLTRISGLDATSSVEGLTAAVNAFKKEGLSTTDIINKLVAVDNKYAVSSADLIEAIKRSGSFAQDAGLSFDELAATVTVLQEVTARGGSVIGNSLKTIFERVRRPESIKQLQNLGVEVRNVGGQMLPAIKIIDNFAKKVSGLNDTEKQGALRQLAGTLQINQLSALVGILGEAESAANRYDAVLKTSQDASVEAAVANNKLNESLDAQVKALTATATQFGSAFGNLSLAPLLKDFLSGSQDILKPIIDNLQQEGPSFTKAIAKVVGDGFVVALAAGGLAVGKFILQFAKFAKDSFSTVLRLNESTKNQESIQLSVLNILRSRADIEQALASAGNDQVAKARILRQEFEAIARADAERLAISKAFASTFGGNFTVGSSGVPLPRGKRAAGGYVPNLIQAEYSDIKKGVGGADKNSKVVLLKNFPFGGGKTGTMVANTSEAVMPMGKGAAILNKDMLGQRAAEGFKLPLGFSPQLKSGKFSGQSSLIEQQVTDLIQLLVGAGKSAFEINNALRAAIKPFDLQVSSAKEVARAGNDYARTLERANKAAEEAYQKTATKGNPLALRRPVTTFPGVEMTNPLGRYEPIRGYGIASDPLTRATQIGQERLLSSMAANPRGRGLSTVVQDSLVRSRTSGGSISSFGAGGKLANEQSSLLQETTKLKKSFGEATIEFGSATASIFLGASLAKESLSLLGVESTKFVDTIRDAIIALVAIKKLGDIGGINAGSLSSFRGKGGKFGQAFSLGRQGIQGSAFNLLTGGSRVSRVGGALGRGVGSIAGLASGFVRLLPVIGQFAAGLFLVNTVLESFGVDTVGAIKKAFGGLSEEGTRATKGLEEFSKSLFENGKFVGRTREDASRNLQTRIEQERERIRATRQGVNTSGKNPDEIAAENFRKELRDTISNVAVGGRVPTFKTVSQPGLGGRGGIGGSLVQIPSGDRAKTFSDLSNDTQAVVLDTISELFALNLEELKNVARDQKIPVNGGESIQQLRQAVSKAAAERLAPRINAAGANDLGPIPLQSELRKFIQPAKAASEKRAAGFGADSFITPQLAQTQIASALELQRLQVGFASASERALETKIKSSQLDEVQKTLLQNQLTSLQKEREIRSSIFDIAAKGIEKLSASEGFQSGQILKKDLEDSVAAIKELGGAPLETLASLKETFSKLGLSGESKLISDEINSQLDGYQNISALLKEQTKILNDQSLIEAKINENIRLRQSLIQLQGDVRTSRLESSRGTIENQISLISAKSSNPSLGITSQESAKRKELELQKQSLEVQRQIAEETAKTKSAELSARGGINVVERGLEQAKIDEELRRTNDSINAQISVLRIQAQQIGVVKDAFTSANDAVVQFYRSLGELEGSNTFSLLQSGDFSSLLSGLNQKGAIKDLVGSGKTGEEGISYYTERLNIRQKESDIASAQTQAQKIQLEQELKLLQDIFRIKQGGGSEEEKITKLIEAQNSRLKEQRSIRYGASTALAQIKDEANQFGSTFGETATLGFRDAISEALKAAANNTGDLKNALLDVALSFANKLRDAALDNLANIIVGGATGGSGGGGILSGILGAFAGNKKATGGRVTGGSGNKDDVPTLLMGGEYVINKKSVQKYGPQFFEALNQGKAGGMASGGMFDPGYSGKSITGAGNLLKFAGQSFTSGNRDKILGLSGNAAAVSLEPESQRLTAFGRENSLLFGATQDAKAQALDLVFQDANLRKQYKEGLKAKDKAEKEKLKQLYISLGLAVVGGSLSSLGSGAKASTLGSTTATGGRYVSERPSSLPSSQRAVIRSSSSASNVSAGATRNLGNLNLPSGGGYNINNYNNPLFNYRASGGSVGGNGYGDNVPAMLTGGEFVMNRRASKKLGINNLSAANSGQSLGVSEEKSEELNNKIVSKLDELVQAISSTGGGVQVNVQMDSQGKTKTSESGSQSDDQKNLNRRIKDAVVAILQEEKRLGGVLR